MEKKVLLITGGSSGIGLRTARLFAENGWKVYEFSRHASATEGVCHITCDVTDESGVHTAVNRIAEQQGKIDLLINNAGFGISGAVEFTEKEDAERQFEVNFFGMVNLCKAVIPVMRQCGRGRIINMSSLAAVAPIPFQTYYSAAKAAVNAYTMALANELRPFHIEVCAMLPGDIHTGFTAARKKSVAGDAEYSGRISASVSKMEKDETHGMDPIQIARKLYSIACRRHVKPFYTARPDYQLIRILTKLLPDRLLNRIIGLLYA